MIIHAVRYMLFKKLFIVDPLHFDTDSDPFSGKTDPSPDPT